MMAAGLAPELVHRAAVRALNTTVGLNRQKYARMTVPSFIFRAGAMQRQIMRANDDDRIGGGTGGHGKPFTGVIVKTSYCTI